MAKEPYEKPEVTTIDLGNLIDEAERGAAECLVKLAWIRRETEGARGCLEALLGDSVTVERQLDEVKKKLLVAQTALELQERMAVHGQKPAGG